MKIVVAPDSFKESLSAFDVAKAMEEGVKARAPEAIVKLVPMADGGEGTVDTLSAYKKDAHTVHVKNPLGRKVEATYITLPYKGKDVAVIECAASTGIDLVPRKERDPFLLNSYGLGEQIAHAVEQGIRHIVVTLGGSATTDGGTGMLQALGYRFLDEAGEELSMDRNVLCDVASIDGSGVLEELEECTFTIACDVSNPFYGKNGAAFVYGPQKGATSLDVEQLDAGLRQFAEVTREHTGSDITHVPGAGAAGGLGGALAGFLQGQMQPGFELVADLTGLEEELREADLVFTGEGKLDSQSMNGKVPIGVAKTAEKYGIPSVAFGGSVETECDYSPLSAVFSIQHGPGTLEEAMDADNASRNISFLAKQVVGLFM
ncbi:glycerate kinase family protein [Salimicrobium halophilum]|uniref:Glycerate kinase n=1 Tax=Salimicrobium halophilum TaxID=86666 RepID=A0A1G8S9J2_9BACI|nr:glycerate kinase [Salimicrobium halophilum]SDJ25340.1 glycerate kinase [Salimicrobium halophilum]